MSIAYRIDQYMEEKCSSLLSYTTASVITDHKGTILSINDPFQRLLQLEKEQIMGELLSQFVIFPASLLSQKDDGFRCKGKLITQDQKTKCVDIQLKIKVSEGRSYYVFSFYIEYAYKTMIHQLFSSLPMGIILVDEQQIILNINQVACSLLELDYSAILYAPLSQVLRNISGQHDQLSLMRGVFQAPDQYQQYDLHWNTTDGKRNLHVSVNPIMDENDGFIGTLYFFEDQTEQRSLERQILDHNRLATIGQIAAGSAHEIRNPLTSIKGFLQMFYTQLEETGQAKEQKYIQLMLKEINRINHLVGEFLLLSKPRQIDYQYVCLLQVIDEIFPIIQSEAILHEIDFAVFKKQKHYPLVCVDSKLVKQVFLNLCKNAIEAMNGSGSLMMEIDFQSHDKQDVIVHIKDTGPGIPEHLLDQVFKPFFTTKNKGTGLGLPICKQIMKDLGGQISISSVGNGTTFSIHIPAV